MAATFLTNDDLWQTLTRLAKSTGHVDAAFAYFGRGAAKLLPLGHGDRLVVDMSTGTVKAGSTDPNEIEKLISRGVSVFTRANLHAKLIVTDRKLLVGSANVSTHSHDDLDEAAILTRDQTAIRRAKQFIDRLCTEPVRPEYLDLCKGIYAPPHRPRTPGNRSKASSRTTHAKLWMLNLVHASIPDTELNRYQKGTARAEELVRSRTRSKTDSFHWPTRPKMADELEPGDWLLRCIKQEDGTIKVYPPGAFLFLDEYLRDQEQLKKRFVFHLEVPIRDQPLLWPEFRARAKKVLDALSLGTPRTKAIRDLELADKLLAIWTRSGNVSRK